MNPLNLLPENFRTGLYVGYAMTVLVLGGVLAGYAAIGTTPPVVVVGILAGMNFVGAGLGFTAAANVKVSTPNVASIDIVPEDDVAGEGEPDADVVYVEDTEGEEVSADDAEPPSTGQAAVIAAVNATI